MAQQEDVSLIVSDEGAGPNSTAAARKAAELQEVDLGAVATATTPSKPAETAAK